MTEDFHPDIIIGSVVSSNPGKPQEGDIIGQAGKHDHAENRLLRSRFYGHPDDLQIR